MAKQLIVVLLPGTSLTDWQRADAPNLHRLLATGAVAVMNTRTARLPDDHQRETPQSAALTLGAGSRAAGGVEAADFHRSGSLLGEIGVTAGTLYARRLGGWPPSAGLVNIQWSRVLRENTGRGYDIHPGDLADALHRAGVTVQAVGGPLAFVAAADGAGLIAPNSGLLGSRGQCVFWDAGSLRWADKKLGMLMARPGDVRLIVLSPDAGDAAYARGERLCPVAVWGHDVPPSLLYSSSTHRAGLVTNTDFAMSVASYFDLPVQAFPVLPFGGGAWVFRPAADAVPRATALEISVETQWRGLRVLPVIAVLIGLWILGATLLAAFRRSPTWVFLVPTVVIFTLVVSTSPVSLAVWLTVSFLFTLFFRTVTITRLAGLIMLILVGDMVLGDPLMQRCLIGYSAIEGARYYGMGNEAMGALIGSGLVFADSLCRRLRPDRTWLVWAGLALTAGLLGSPQAGAKAGGLIVGLASFGVYAWRRSGRRLGFRDLAIGFAAIVFVLLAIAVLDTRHSTGGASHFGQAVARLAAGGWGEWGDIIGRKLAVEGHLLSHSAWAVATWGGAVSLFRRTRHIQPSEASLRDAGWVAVAACLAVNDAGTVAASLCIAILWGGFGQTQKSPGKALALPGN